MNYAEIRNDAGSLMVDDTYENFRLTWVQSAAALEIGQQLATGVHVEIDKQGNRICTYPYLDIADGVSWIWSNRYGRLPRTFRFEDFGSTPGTIIPFGIAYYIGSPFLGWAMSDGYGHAVVRPTLKLAGGAISIMRSKRSGMMVSHIIAVASAMPNIIYTFTQFATEKNFRLARFPFQYRINLWQRAASVELPIYEHGNFAGSNVGYTELELVREYMAPGTDIKSHFKTKDNEKFKHWSFEQEARFATMLFFYGLEDSSIKNDYGEMIIKNERGETIFNNRYDYMRILKYIPSINALRLDGGNLRNAPQRFTFPGKKIAVVALQPYSCIANTRKGRPSYIFNTGFWFPDPSTVEFTSCASMIESNFDGYYSADQSCVNMAELINVMILDVTGCTPGWRTEINSKGKYTGFAEW